MSIPSVRNHAYRWPIVLLVMHIFAIIFGLIGILIIVPNIQEIIARDSRALDVYNWSMENAGATHIVLGALAMFAFGVVALGWFRTGVFFAVSVAVSLASELIGTGTGFPFGNYEYTDFLGTKILGRVPYTIPLSWFYVGLSCYLLGVALAHRYSLKRVSIIGVLLGAWFLTVWDLVLDPAMAHEDLTIKFWEWSQTGAYFGMPLRNFVGWTLTALIFMAISRLIWRSDPKTNRMPMEFPFVVYLVNSIFAMALSASVDLWIPIGLSIVLGVIPAWLAIRDRYGVTREQLSPAGADA